MIRCLAAAVIVVAVAGAVCTGPALAHKKKIASTISIEFATEAGVDGISGVVTAKTPCEEGRKVTVFEETSAGGQPYGTSRTAAGGDWALELSLPVSPGFYYAKAARKKFNHRRGRRHRSVCKPAFSDTIEVPPH